ncbi:hypothetical protein T10_604 [Trichinella papuae]|uniref:Uncharacterized protein n=1 Tax=Trichinella papuae TaxID=268474 RepID=A0A0V1N8E7_9BILA|nr:hypothetical protein T10_604 [Trichinella papuae]
MSDCRVVISLNLEVTSHNFGDSGTDLRTRVDLSDGAKLTYLRSCLTSDAWGAIAGPSTTNADYEVTVQRLKERFEWHFVVDDRDQKEVEEPKPVSVNLISLNESGCTRLQDVADELGLRSETLSIAVHGFGGGSREAQKSQLVHFWLSPFAGVSQHLVKALTMETLCHNIVR